MVKREMEQKIYLCSYAICGIIAWLFGHHTWLFQLLALMWAFDTVTWVIRYWRLKRLNSRSLRFWTISKWLLLFVPIGVYATLNAIVPWAADLITTVMLSAICLSELISSIQNIQVAKTGVDITEQDAVTKVINGMLAYTNILLDTVLKRLQPPR